MGRKTFTLRGTSPSTGGLPLYFLLVSKKKKDKTEIDSLLPRKISRDGWMQRRYHEMKNGNLRPPDDRNIFWLKAIVDPSMLD